MLALHIRWEYTLAKKMMMDDNLTKKKTQLINGLCEVLRKSLLLLKQICLTFKSCKGYPLIICITTKPKILPLSPVLEIPELLKDLVSLRCNFVVM